jgi:cytochrome c biogenesis protein CcdA
MTYPPGPPAPPAPAGDPGAPPWQRGTNVLSVVSLVLSLLSFCVLPVVGAVAGIITGHVARRQIRETGEEGAGLATAGIVVGWIHVGLALLLTAGAVALLAFGVMAGNNGSPVPLPT